MIDTTTFARKKIDTATEVLGVDGNYVYTQTIQDGMLVKQIKFLDAWMGVETEIKQFLFPMTFMSVRLGHSHLISKYARDSNRYVVVKTATMTGYELDLENSHEYAIGLIHIGIIDHVGKKIKLYSHNGTLVNAIDFSNEKTWDYGTRFWVERYPGMRPITNVGVIDITEGPFSVLIQAGSDGLEVLRGPNRFKFIRSDAQGQHDPYGVFGSMPYGLLRDGLNKLGVWRMGDKMYNGYYSSVTTLCVSETGAPITSNPVTDAPVTSSPATAAPETVAPETEEPTIPAPGTITTQAGSPTSKPNTSAPTVKPTTKPSTTKAVSETTTASPKSAPTESDPVITIVIKTSNAASVVAGFVIVIVAILCQFL
jgi:hypothetical protein